MSSPIKYVKKKQIYMCDFEATSPINNNNIKSNVQPEIGKKRPVIIIRKIKNKKLALIVPLTTLEPNCHDISTFINKSELPGILNNKNSWALCEFIQVVSLTRLTLVFANQNHTSRKFIDTKKETIHDNIFQDILKNLRYIFRT